MRNLRAASPMTSFMVQISAQLETVLFDRTGSRSRVEWSRGAYSFVEMARGRNRAAWLRTVSIEEPACRLKARWLLWFETFCLWPSSKKKKKKADSRSSPIQALRPFADRFTFDDPLVPMVRLTLIANDVISMVVLVQNEFAFRPNNSTL